VIDMMTKQVRPVSGKPITTLALEAVEQRLASARADFIMARSHTRSTKEAEDTFAVSLDVSSRTTTLERAPNATSLRPRQGQAALPGGALRAALTRPTRRGALQLRDEGQAFVAGYDYATKDLIP